jgi:hypothetical protein
MKKVLLSLSFLMGMYAAVGQTTVTAVSGALSTTAAKDDFASATELSGPAANATLTPTGANGDCAPAGTGEAYNGLFWWTNTGEDGFTAANSRTTNAGKVTYTITQPYNSYKPVGVGFGAYCDGSTKGDFVLDMSGTGTDAKKVKFDFTNLSGTDNVKIEVQLQCANGTIMTLLNTALNSGGVDDWQYQQLYLVNAGQTLSIVRDFADAVTGAYGSAHATPTTADFQSAKAITITVTNQTVDGSFNPLAITDFQFTIDNFSIGDVTTITTGVNEASSIASSKLFPNPATSEANIALELKANSDVKVVVSDVLGKEMMTVAEGSFSSLNKSFSVETLNNGVYNVTYYVNGAVAKTELLMVK